VPLTIQPVIAALDNIEAIVSSFGGTISAAVSSGPAIVIAGGSIAAVTGLGGYLGLTLALTGAPSLVTVTFSSGLLAITSATFFLSATGAVALAISPTRVDTPYRVGRVGDAIDFTETLKGKDGTPQDLSGGTVVFSLDGPDGVPIVANAAATVLQSGQTNIGRVTYRVGASVIVPAGVSRWRYKVVWNADTKLSFPDSEDGTLTMIPDLP
jgi:hypothetical protein